MERLQVTLDIPERCPKCGRKLDMQEAMAIEPDPLEHGKGRGYHPKCFAVVAYERNGYGGYGW